jgi:O-6-methylguanine DNA methyltransferase
MELVSIYEDDKYEVHDDKYEAQDDISVGAARTVGTAMARNRLPIVIPCHRVAKNDGSVGFFAGSVEGSGFAQRLLEMEARGMSCCG